MIPMEDNISFVFIVYLSGYYFKMCVEHQLCIIAYYCAKSRHSVWVSFYICHQ